MAACSAAAAAWEQIGHSRSAWTVRDHARHCAQPWKRHLLHPGFSLTGFCCVFAASAKVFFCSAVMAFHCQAAAALFSGKVMSGALKEARKEFHPASLCAWGGHGVGPAAAAAEAEGGHGVGPAAATAEAETSGRRLSSEVSSRVAAAAAGFFATACAACCIEGLRGLARKALSNSRLISRSSPSRSAAAASVGKISASSSPSSAAAASARPSSDVGEVSA